MIFNRHRSKSLCYGEYRKSQLMFLLDAIFINAAYVLTTGVVLSGYVIYLGAQDFLVALLNNSMNYSTIFCLFSFIIFERLSKRKRTLLTMNLISRSLICLIVVLPLIIPNRTVMLTLVAVMVIASDTIWGIYRVGWIVWVMNMAPKETKTQYVYFRMFLIRIAMSLTTMASGFILDIFGKGYMGFVVVFSISFILSVLDVIVLKNTEEIEYPVTRNEKNNFSIFLQPIKLKEFRYFLLFIFTFYLFQTMATSFTPIYLIRYLKFDYKFISTINVISLIVMILSNRFWSQVESVKGYKFVLGITSAFVAGELLILSFLSKETYFLLFISTIISGIGMGGFGVSIFTYRYEIMPEAGRTMYEGWFYFASGLGMLIAPFAGNALVSSLPEFTNIVYKNSKIQLLYLVAFVLLGVLIFASFVKPSVFKKSEAGEGAQQVEL